MKAAYIEKTGPPEAIKVDLLADPVARPGQALVRVHAAAVNPIDTYVRSGAVPMELPTPFVIGCDLAGEVVTGGGRFSPGDRVWGSNQGLLGRQGTFSELVAVDEEWLYPTPEGVSDETAAAGALVGITAHLGLVNEAIVQPGDVVFINGGSGGVGSTVIQMAKALGAKVIATAGSQQKVKLCQELGADLAINYKTDDIPAAVSGFAPDGANIWWETTREPAFDRILECLAERGRIVVMAGREARPELPVGPFYVKECRMHGFVMFKATPEEQRAAADDINRWLTSGEYRPRIDRVLPLDQAAEAHRIQEDNTLHGAGTLAGKIVVRVSGE